MDKMDKLDGSYIRGFTAGLMMGKEILGYIAEDMKIHRRRYNKSELQKVFDCAIESRETLRENPNAFVRCRKDGGYEVFVSGRR